MRLTSKTIFNIASLFATIVILKKELANLKNDHQKELSLTLHLFLPYKGCNLSSFDDHQAWMKIITNMIKVLSPKV